MTTRRHFKRRARKSKSPATIELPQVGMAKLAEAAKLLNLNEKTLRNKSESGEWPGRKIAGRWRFPWTWLNEMTGAVG
jgi:hypothetical protein